MATHEAAYLAGGRTRDGPDADEAPQVLARRPLTPLGRYCTCVLRVLPRGEELETMKTPPHLSERLHLAHDWVDAAGELGTLRQLSGAELDAYADQCESNAIEHDLLDVLASEIVELSEWLRDNPTYHGGHRWEGSSDAD